MRAARRQNASAPQGSNRTDTVAPKYYRSRQTAQGSTRGAANSGRNVSPKLSQASGPSSAPRLLIAEDEYLILELVAYYVELLGYRVSGRAASLEQVRSELGNPNFDGVLLDIRLGSTLSTEVADLLLERGTPFAFVTGYDHTLEPRHARVPLLRKPFTAEQLRAVLEKIVGPARPRGTDELLSAG